MDMTPGGAAAAASAVASAAVHAFDLLVIGGGSGGLASARRAASLYKKRVALIESAEWLGGTCVNVGCVPKKVMFNAATLRENVLMYARDHHVLPGDIASSLAASGGVDFHALKQSRDAYVRRLNGIYANSMANAGVVHVRGTATFLDSHRVAVSTAAGGDASASSTTASAVYTAPHIIIATGGRPTMLPVPGIRYALNSDGFFDLEALPRRVAVIGSGYIGVELAGILRALGSEVHLLMRHDKPLRHFDPMLQDSVLQSLTHSGVHVHPNTRVASIVDSTATGDDDATTAEDDIKLHRRLTAAATVNEHKLRLHLASTVDGSTESATDIEVQTVICATGRHPNTEPLRLDRAGVQLMADGSGHIATDKFQNTTADGVYAVGDVCGPVELTPVAIAAGRRLCDRLFSGRSEDSQRHLDYNSVPSVVFSHPPCGAVGLTEPEARAKYGTDAVKVYQSRFNNLFYALSPADNKVPTVYKLVVVGAEERVVGVHLFGMSSDEVLQGFAVAVKMGATKRELDDTVAIHPTAAEELVTMT